MMSPPSLECRRRDPSIAGLSKGTRQTFALDLT
jgi:hypothetical protein